MTNARTFLDSLNDCELSFVYFYRYNTYIENSGQQLLDDEISRRRLTHERVQEYIRETEYQLSNTGCVRCNSPKPLIDNVCQVCTHVFTPNRIIRPEKYPIWTDKILMEFLRSIRSGP